MGKIILAISCGMILFPLQVWGGNFAVRPDCPTNGNGMNWACASSPGGEGARNTIPASDGITRGDTYYFGDGTITFSASYQMDKEASGTTRITFKKATASDYGGLPNWVGTYGDGTTTFTSPKEAIFFTKTGYYTFDGVLNGGSNPNKYGFIMTSGTTSVENAYIIWDGFMNYPSFGHIIKNVAFINRGKSFDIEQIIIYGAYSNMLLQGNYFGESQNFIQGLLANVTIENNYFKNNWSSGAHHGESLSVCPSSGFIVRNNTFDNAVNGTCGIGCQTGSGTMTGWQIYNNIVIGGTAGNGFVSNNEESTTTVNLSVFNNTFVDTNATTYIKGAGSVGTAIRNNIYYNSAGADGNCTGCTWSYNYYTAGSTIPSSAQPGKIVDTSDPFLDRAARDFRLLSGSKARNAGIDLGVPYDIDFFGVVRPPGGPWDTGAIQGGFVQPKKPKPPGYVHVK